MKRKIYTIVFIFAETLLMGIFFGYIQTLNSWLHWILFFAFLALLALQSWYLTCNRHQPLVLSEEELRVPVKEHQDFSNGNSYKKWSDSLLAIVLLLFLPSWIWVQNTTQMWLEGKTWDEIWAFHAGVLQVFLTSFTFWILMIIWIAGWLRAMLRTAKNKYIIDGDTLLIQENFLFKTEEEIRIPIACIDEVYVSSKLSPNPSLWIKVNGVTRRCYSYYQAIELGKAILRHKHAIQHQ